MTTVKNIYDCLDKQFSFATQEPWDNSGFLVGEWKKEVKKAVLTLDVTKECVSFAAENGAQLILSHHPLIFSGIKTVTAGTPVYDCVQNGIAVISCHTCLDKAEGGINDTLLSLLGLTKLGRGDDGFLTFAETKTPVSLQAFVKHVADTLHVHGIRWAGAERSVQKVAVCSGAGDNAFIAAAQEWGADVYLTGDMKYHEMLDAAENGFAVISAGHYETEYLPAVTALQKMTSIFTDVQFLTFDQPNAVQTV